MHNLAVMFTQRDTGEPDYVSASQWFAKAATHGLADSQFNLGILHENGMGVPKAPAEAYKWYALAAERGDPEAGKRRDVLSARLAAADIEALRMSVAKWRSQPIDPSANDPYMAGQAWRMRNGDDRLGAATGTNPAPVARTQAIRQEAEIIDLTDAGIDAQLKKDGVTKPVNNAVGLLNQPGATNAGDGRPSATGPSATGPADGAEAAGRKRKVSKAPAQNPADVEKMLAQFGYNPSALKKARPGGSPEDTSNAQANAE
jgi:Sel1 repeat